MTAEGQSPHLTRRPLWASGERSRVSNVSRRGSFGNAFTVQYTSVILILLTVTVGSFSARHDNPLVPCPRPPNFEQPPLAAVSLPDLFSENSSHPTEDGLYALRELISHHDIRARLVLPLETEDAELSFHRFMVITRAAIDSGITPDLLSVELDERVQGAPLLIIEPTSST